jgi:hypothetical protein
MHGECRPSSNSDLEGSDWGFYGQTTLAPVEKLEIRTGVRFDSHVAPFAGNQHQWSPRVKVSWFPNEANTLYATTVPLHPTNVEDLRAITSVADSGVVAQLRSPSATTSTSSATFSDSHLASG